MTKDDVTVYFFLGDDMGKTVVCGNFEWDEDKAKVNIKKHGVSFEEILPMFDDPLFWEQFDFTDTTSENRYFGTGTINNFTVVVSTYVQRDRVRIISARYATQTERREYERWCSEYRT